jgi:hypothetical protein
LRVYNERLRGGGKDLRVQDSDLNGLVSLHQKFKHTILWAHFISLRQNFMVQGLEFKV